MSQIHAALEVALLIGAIDPSKCRFGDLVSLQLELVKPTISKHILEIIEDRCASFSAKSLIPMFDLARHHAIKSVLSEILQVKLGGLQDHELPGLIELCMDNESQRDVVFEIRKRNNYPVMELQQMYEAASYHLPQQWITRMIAEHPDSTAQTLISMWAECQDRQTRQILLEAAETKPDFDVYVLVGLFSQIRFADMKREILETAEKYRSNWVATVMEYIDRR